MNKYGNKKVEYDGHVFDSKAECEFYKYLVANGYEFKMQERFEVIPQNRHKGNLIRKVEYKPDFTIYQDGKLVAVIDVKGMILEVFKLKAKAFFNTYGKPIVLVKFTINRGFEYRYSYENDKKWRALDMENILNNEIGETV